MSGTKHADLRPRRTERAHRGKPDFYSPSDYENPFKKQQKKRANSVEAEPKKKKGRPKGSFKAFKNNTAIPKVEGQSLKEEEEKSIETSENMKKASASTTDSNTRITKSQSPPDAALEKKKQSTAINSKTIQIAKPATTPMKVTAKPSPEVEEPEVKATSKHLQLCTLNKDLNIIKEKSKDDANGKDNSKQQQTDLYSALTPEKTLQCAIILAEINRKFICQNFKPA